MKKGTLTEVSFGEWLKRQRRSRGLTQEQLAHQIGCATITLRKIESEERHPSAAIVDQLSKIFEIPQNEQSNFLKFARGDWTKAPIEKSDELPWQLSKSPRTNLPATVTSLIGREEQLAEIHDYLLQAEIRLVTLIGPPGMGKTRLSIEAARQCLSDFADGVFFAGLASLDDPNLIASTVRQALGYMETQKLSVEQQLKKSIGEKQILLVLDNCEHLIEEAALFASGLLSTCPNLKILATSREALHIPGEWLYTVPSLDLPQETLRNEASFSKYPALTLFAERARAVRNDFSLNVENIQTVSTICAGLDGMPLAIELIAARVRIMPPQTLLERLNDQFVLSVEGVRTASVRQKTLNNAIGWSYGLLSEEEQKCFAYLSVFSGGFTLEVAETMFSSRITGKPVSELIALLLDKSLLQRISSEDNELFYTMLVTLREYARHRLREMGEEAEIRNGHLTYYLGLAEDAYQELNGPNQVNWLRHLADVRDDLHSALNWAIETHQTETALQLGGYLPRFWMLRSDFSEERRWLEKVTNMRDASKYPRLYSYVLAQLAYSTWVQVGGRQARPFAEQALSVAHQDEDTWNLAWVSVVFGFVLIDEGDFTGAESMFEKGKILFREVPDEWEYAQAVSGHALSALHWGALPLSLTLMEKSLATYRQLGNKAWVATILRFIGNVEVKQNNLKEVKRHFEKLLVSLVSLTSNLRSLPQ